MNTVQNSASRARIVFHRGRRAVSRRVRSRTGAIGAIIAAGALFLALCGPLLAPRDPNAQDLKNPLLPPDLGARSSHVLGTDQLGRDVLSRLISGARVSVSIGVTVALLSCVLGVLVGLLSGYYGGIIDTVLMRITDVFLGFPTFLLAVSFAATLGQGISKIILALILTGWMIYARVVRSEVLKFREMDFVKAAVVLGCTDRRIILLHILPNCASCSLVLATLHVGVAMIAEAALAFLGVGVPVFRATWGQMLAGGRDYLFSAWWLTTFPGLAISITVLGFNLLGDWLRDVLDPTLRSA